MKPCIRAAVCGVVLVVLVLVPAWVASAQPEPAPQVTGSSTGQEHSPAQGDGPEVIPLSVYVVRISQLDLKTATFDADVLLTMPCKGECDWQAIGIENGHVTNSKEVRRDGDVITIGMDLDVSFKPDLHKYPTDSQVLPIVFQHADASAEQVQLVPDLNHSGIDTEDFDIPGWYISGWSASSADHSDEMFAEAPSQLTFAVIVEHSLLPATLWYGLPILAVIALAFLPLLARNPRDQKRAVGTALLGTLLFWLAVSTRTPPTSYLTQLDKIFAAVYVSLVLLMVATILEERAEYAYQADSGSDTAEPSPRAVAIHKWSSIICPCVLLLGILLSIVTS